MTLRVLLAALILAAAPSLAVAQTLRSDSAPVRAALAYVEAQAPALGLVPADAVSPLVTDAYVDEATGIGHVYLRQQVGGIEVADANLNVTIGRTGEVAAAVGAFLPEVAGRARAAGSAPALTAEDAVRRAAAIAGEAAPGQLVVATSLTAPSRAVTFEDAAFSLMPITARLVYQPMEDGSFRLAWETLFYPTHAEHLWVVRVDATTGAELARFDLVDHDTWGEALETAQENVGPWLFNDEPLMAASSALVGSYKVYAMPLESPAHAGNPLTDLRTTVANPDNALASPFGWHDTNGAAGAEFTTTQGNNVSAYTDTNADNTPDAGSAPDGTASLTFAPALDLTQAPAAYLPAAVVNLFYWNNIIHDVMYQYGFHDAAGNFQTNNYGRGGAGNDAVRAEAQDGSGTSNANFATPPDGWGGRMQMYRWTPATPDRDSDFDAGVIAHEYTHGISNRLTGGPSAVGCLGNSEQMGEGWSDFVGLMLTMRTGDTRTTNRGVGTYVQNQATTGTGIRPAPYNTNTAVNNYNYQNSRTAAVPHGVGFVWATILWEATWDMIDAHGFDSNIYNAGGTAGNQMMLRLVTEAMKLQPCAPGFVDGRDAILLADNLLYGGAHRTLLWTAFARRGLGYDAVQGSTASNADNTNGFALPPAAPVANVASAAVTVTSGPGLSTARTVQVANAAAAGAQPLTYSATLDYTDAASPAGGPDASGYSYRTSADPGGPTFVWNDISATGTAVTFTPNTDDGVSAAITLPFTFSLYGTSVTSIRIHTNGFITSGASNATTYGHSLPSTIAPNGVISPFWCDLDGGAVRTFNDTANGRFIIQYTNVRLYDEPATSYTFQAVLYPSGRVEYYYNSMTPSASASVGVENATGTIGLQVTRPITSSMAVRIEPTSWLSLSTAATGSVAAGASTNLGLTLNAGTLAAGTYTANLVVRTNAAAPTTVPITLIVGGNAVQVAGQAGWRMMAAPTGSMTVANLASQNLVQGVPGYYPTAGTNLYTGYNGTGYTAPAAGTDPLPSGRGFIWYFYNQNLTPGGASNSVALPMSVATPVAATEPASNVAVTLHAAGNKWNLVGNPFMSGLDVSTIPAWASGGALSSAVGQVWDPNVGGSGSYILTSTTGAVVAPWQGFFVENNTATTLTIPTSARIAAGVFHRTVEVDTRLVAFELAASTPSGGSLLDRAIALYFHPDGTDAWDLWDATKLTPISTPYATLAFEGTRDGNPVLKAQDSRPYEAATFSVPMALTAVGTATTFTLRWPQMTNVPATWTITLQDIVTGTNVDLRATDHYDFTATPTAAAGNPETPSAVAANASQAVTRFILTVTTTTTATEGGATPATFALGEPTPNPSAGAVALRYDVPTAGDVRLEVFDLLGRRVATLADGPAQAGRYTARWEPQGLSSGTYVVRMISGDVVLARRVTLVR